MSAKFSSHLFPVEIGQVISIYGKTKASAKRFDVNLLSGNSDQEDIHLSLSVMFNEDRIVRNDYTKHVGWGREETEENLILRSCLNPIQRNECDFKIAIYVDTTVFLVSINEKPYCTFAHRKPINEIQELTIEKDIETIYQVDHFTALPTRWPLFNSGIFRGLLPRKYKPGNVITVTAVAKGKEGNFAFNLMNECSGRKFLHVRPYFSTKKIALNDMDEKNW